MFGGESLTILAGLGETLAVLFCSVAAYCWVRRGPLDRDSRWKLAAEAGILSLVICYGLLAAAPASPGLFFDARFVLITLATLFSGPLVGAVVTTAFSALRWWIGGIGVAPGLFTAWAVFAVACLCRNWFQGRGRTPRQRDLLIVSLIVTTVSMLGVLFLPWDGDTLARAARSAAALWIINPLGLFFLSALALWDERTKQLQLAYANETAQFRAVVDNLPASLVIYDRDERITLMNRRYEQIYGPEIMRFVGRPLSELRAAIVPDLIERQELVQGDPERPEAGPVTYYLQDAVIGGKERSILLTRFEIPDASGAAGGGGGGRIGVDISELRKSQRETEMLQAQLIHASKMEAIGQLAGGIAHDFNNLLGAIIGYASFLDEDLGPDPELRAYVTKILRVCDRAKTLVEQVLAFARADRVERRRIDLRTVIAETRDLIRLPPTTELSFDLGAEAQWMEANEGQISQLIINLCVNGSDALGGKSGKLAVSLCRITATAAQAALCYAAHPARHSGGQITVGRDYIRILVRDDGPGIEPETLKRIMEPFFTTKGRSEGTGLGLPLVHAIVISYRGAYVIESAPGQGTCFSVFLPYDPAAEAAPIAAEVPAPRTMRGRERVLIVDDEDDIREVYAIGLERLGFEVACSHDPLEALEVFKEDPQVWDVVVSDEIMPGLAGSEMLRRMRALRPNLPTILCTGFGELITNQPVPMAQIDVALSKPIEPKKLAEHIRKLIDG